MVEHMGLEQESIKIKCIIDYMNKDVEVRKSAKQGKRVFACRDFKEGDFVLQIDDSHVVTDESKLAKEEHEFHCDYLGDKIVLMQEP